MDIVTVFTDIDDFCLLFEPMWQQRLMPQSPTQRQRKSTLGLSEVLTILVLFHSSGYRNFKTFYLQFVQKHLVWAFPRLVSYNRFVELQRGALMPLWAFLVTRCGSCTGISFVDSTKLAVCHNRRILQHKQFADCAERGKTSVDWFYGFKLHLLINDGGEIVAFYLTPGNCDDRQAVPHLAREVWGKLFGDKGYISQLLTERLAAQGIQLVTKLKKKMKQKLLPFFDKILLRKRAVIEAVIDQLKNISQIEHTRHRSLWNFLGNVAAGLIAYSYQEKKPSLNLNVKEQLSLQSVIF